MRAANLNANYPIQSMLAKSHMSAKKKGHIAKQTAPLVTRIKKLDSQSVSIKTEMDKITKELYASTNKEYTRLKAKIASLECDLVIVLAKLTHAEIVLEAKIKQLTQTGGNKSNG